MQTEVQQWVSSAFEDVLTKLNNLGHIISKTVSHEKERIDKLLERISKLEGQLNPERNELTYHDLCKRAGIPCPPKQENKPWGQSCQIDIKNCDPVNEQAIRAYLKAIVKQIEMKAYGDPVIVYFGTGDKQGYTAIQLIETSNITCHFSEENNAAYIDIFSCKDFNVTSAAMFSKGFFGADSVEVQIQVRN